MKLNRSTNTVQTSYDATSIVSSGIKNPAIIFDILVNKMYGNPLRVLVQEYMSNARDSHRELEQKLSKQGVMFGEDAPTKKPIRVVLPTDIAPTLKIQDFGVGISPERMFDVFIFLGESTKNMDDLQTGGFGVGAKVGWAYTDNFTVHTVFNGIKYTYLAFLGDERIGQFQLLNQVETDEQNGTVIEIDIKTRDFHRVKEYVLQTGHFWDVRPEVVGSTYNDNYVVDQLTDKLHVLNPKKDGGTWYLNWNGGINAVVDGIIYHNIHTELKDSHQSLFSLKNGQTMYMFYKTGDVEIAVNRENLHFTDKTKRALTNTMSNAVKSAKESIEKFIDSHTTISEVLKNVNTIEKFIRYLTDTKFKFCDKALVFKPTLFGISVKYSFGEDAYVYKYEYSGGKLKIAGSSRYSKPEPTNTVKLNLDAEKIKNTIFNSKGVKSIKSKEVKQYMHDNDLSIIYIVTPRINLESFFKYHESIKEILDNMPQLKDIHDMFKDVVVKDSNGKNMVIKRRLPAIEFEYRGRSYTRKRSKYSRERVDLSDNTIDNYKIVYIPYGGVGDGFIDRITNIISLYNTEFNENYKFYMILKKTQEFITDRDDFITVNDFYNIVGDSIHGRIPDEYYYNQVIRYNKFTDEYNFPVSKQIITEYKVELCETSFSKLVKLDDTIRKIINRKSGVCKSDNKNITDLRNAISGFYVFDEAVGKIKMEQLRKLLVRKSKQAKKLSKKLNKEFPLLSAIRYSADDKDVVEYIVLKNKQLQMEG